MLLTHHHSVGTFRIIVFFDPPLPHHDPKSTCIQFMVVGLVGSAGLDRNVQKLLCITERKRFILSESDGMRNNPAQPEHGVAGGVPMFL